MRWLSLGVAILLWAAVASAQETARFRSRVGAGVVAGTESDAQVFQADFDALQAVARTRPGSDAKLFPGLTHIFTPTGGPAEVRAIFQPARVPAEVFDATAAWVKGIGK
jgi:hypothetical protein